MGGREQVMERGPLPTDAGARLLYYAELDPFAGIGQTAADFRAALIEVTTSCLLFDVVKVQPDNLLGHSLTLPIFERLAPFVRAGRLTTSADARAAPPHEYLHTRVAEAMVRSARGRGRDHAQRRRELEEMRRRFAALMPARWIVSRSVRAQVGMFAERMRRYLAEAPRGARVEARLLGWIERALDAGVRVDRDFVFAHLARLRDSASPRDLARLGAVAQALLLEAGALGHAVAVAGARCEVFAGRFAARLTDDDPRRMELARPPFVAAARPQAARRRLRSIGVSLDALLALPPAELVEIAASPEWARVRAETPMPADLAEELRARFASARDVRDALPTAAALLDAGPGSPGLRVAAPWQLATQAVLTTALPAATSRGPVLDVARLELRHRGRTASLTRAQAELCVAIAIAGAPGLPVTEWKQLKAEADQLAAAGDGNGELAWRPQLDEPCQRDADRRALLAVTRCTANRALAAVGLSIFVRRGRLRLIRLRRGGAPAGPRVTGTLWELLGAPADTPPPVGLSPGEESIYRALAAAWPGTLAVRALAAALDKPDDDVAIKQTVDAIGKLARRLGALRAPARVGRIRRGIYALVPIAATAGEVH